jgi:hypothetical protein
LIQCFIGTGFTAFFHTEIEAGKKPWTPLFYERKMDAQDLRLARTPDSIPVTVHLENTFHEACVSRKVFERIQRQIESNRRSTTSPGAPRVGKALLQGLILCGQCGRRMRLLYSNRGSQIRYCCARHRIQTGSPVCQDFGGRLLE